MSVLFILIIVSLFVAGSFLAAFLWAIGNGQFDEGCSPSVRILYEDHQDKDKLKHHDNK